MADLTREQLNDARSRWLNGEDPSTEDMASILAMARECLDLREQVAHWRTLYSEAVEAGRAVAFEAGEKGGE